MRPGMAITCFYVLVFLRTPLKSSLPLVFPSLTNASCIFSNTFFNFLEMPVSKNWLFPGASQPSKTFLAIGVVYKKHRSLKIKLKSFIEKYLQTIKCVEGSLLPLEWSTVVCLREYEIHLLRIGDVVPIPWIDRLKKKVLNRFVVVLTNLHRMRIWWVMMNI